MENQCVVSVANLVESSYLIYYYVYNYITTNEEDDVAWATTYSIKLVRGLLEINCVTAVRPSNITLSDEAREYYEQNK